MTRIATNQNKETTRSSSKEITPEATNALLSRFRQQWFRTFPHTRPQLPPVERARGTKSTYNLVNNRLSHRDMIFIRSQRSLGPRFRGTSVDLHGPRLHSRNMEYVIHLSQQSPRPQRGPQQQFHRPR